jgi:hypothetical protein
MRKRGLIVILAGINLLLLGAIVFTVYTPPSAMAQAVGARRGEYLLFSARVEANNDAIYMLDAGNRKLHIFRSFFPRDVLATTVGYVTTRDITRDFAGPAGRGDRVAPGQQQLAPGIIPQGAVPQQPPAGAQP